MSQRFPLTSYLSNLKSYFNNGGFQTVGIFDDKIQEILTLLLADHDGNKRLQIIDQVLNLKIEVNQTLKTVDACINRHTKSSGEDMLEIIQLRLRLAESCELIAKLTEDTDIDLAKLDKYITETKADIANSVEHVVEQD